MSSSNPEIDYNEIIKLLVKKDSATGQLEDEKNVVDMKRWTTLQSYYESKGKFELAKNNDDVAKTILSNKSAMRHNVDQEHAFLDQRLQDLQQLYANVKINSKNQSEIFFDNMEKLYEELQKLPGEFDNENMYLTIKNLKKSVNIYDLEISNADTEMEVLKSFIENVEMTDDLSDVKVVTEIIQEESFERYGNPLKIQHCLSEVRRSNEYLLKRIQDVKVKYGI